MKKIYSFLILSFFVTANSNAQKIDGLAAFVKSGLYSLSSSSSALNKIAPAGFNLQYSSFATLGCEGYYRSNKNIFMLDGDVGLENSEFITSSSVKLYSATMFAKAGWIIKEKEHFWLYPSIGVGISSLNINTYNSKNEAAANVQSHLINNPSIDVGINGDFIFKKLSNPTGQSMITGLRAGYRLSVINKTWKDLNGNTLDNMPSYAQNGFYISLAIGYGIFIKN